VKSYKLFIDVFGVYLVIFWPLGERVDSYWSVAGSHCCPLRKYS